MPDEVVVEIVNVAEVAADSVSYTVSVPAFRNPVTCSRCNVVHERPAQLTTSMFRQCGFVCQNCRCKSCSIVLSFECECGEFHAEPNPADTSICLECTFIHKRVADIAPELTLIRNEDIANEEPIHHCVTRSKQEQEIEENEITGE